MKKLITILTALWLFAVVASAAPIDITANGTKGPYNIIIGKTYAIQISGGFDSSSNSVQILQDDQRNGDPSDDTYVEIPYNPDDVNVEGNPFAAAGGMQFIATGTKCQVVTTAVASAATIIFTITEVHSGN